MRNLHTRQENTKQDLTSHIRRYWAFERWFSGRKLDVRGQNPIYSESATHDWPVKTIYWIQYWHAKSGHTQPPKFKKKWHPQGKKIPPWRIPPHKDAKKPIWNQRLLYVSLTREHHEAMFDTIAASALSLSLRQALRWLVKSSWPSMCEEQCWLLSASNSRLKFSQFLLENEVTLKFKSPPRPQPLAGDHLWPIENAS